MESGSWSKAGAASAPGATLGAADILDGEIEMAEPVTYSQPSRIEYIVYAIQQ
jgi:hypothetical protein